MSDSIQTCGWKTILNFSIRIIIPVLFFLYVFHVINIDDVFIALKKIEWQWFFFGFVCIFLSNILCAVRTRKLMLSDAHSLVKLWSIHSLSAVIAGLLPFRTGEVSFVYFLRKYCVVTGSQALAILVSVRYLEYIFFLIFIFFLATIGIFISPSKLYIAVFAVICLNLGFVLVITWKAGWVYEVLKGITETLLKFLIGKTKSASFLSRMEHFTQNIQSALAINISKRMLLVTILIMLLRQAFALFMLRGMGVVISLWLVILLFAFLYAVKFIQGFGSFGSQESGIAAALILVGYKQSESLLIAIGTHLLQWAPVLLFGFIGYILIFKQPISSGVQYDKSTLKSL